ncbi:MAG: hypothetical protein BWX93_01149 [Bacteroidetes bacterium ADurb.Bin139]|nr:MAG: hypothetical protein BWX93_01149 [Bacteroidetes bacterium ADurb.Bin139]
MSIKSTTVAMDSGLWVASLSMSVMPLMMPNSLLLCLVGFTMVFSRQSNQTLGKSNITNSQCALVDDTAYRMAGVELFAANP